MQTVEVVPHLARIRDVLGFVDEQQDGCFLSVEVEARFEVAVEYRLQGGVGINAKRSGPCVLSRQQGHGALAYIHHIVQYSHYTAVRDGTQLLVHGLDEVQRVP